MPDLYVQEDYVNATTDTRYRNSGEPQRAFTDNVGELFRCLQREYGRCVGKVYVGKGTPVGWVFQKKTEYTDCPETYLQEVWVTLHEKLPERKVKYHYKEIR